MKELEELTREIREKLPRLIYEDEFELFDESNGYRQTEKLLIPEPPMLNDVLDWMPDNNIFMNMSGGLWKDGKIDTISDSQSYMTDIIKLGKWDLSKPYLKDQSPKLIKFLHSLIKTKQ